MDFGSYVGDMAWRRCYIKLNQVERKVRVCPPFQVKLMVDLFLHIPKLGLHRKLWLRSIFFFHWDFVLCLDCCLMVRQ